MDREETIENIITKALENGWKPFKSNYPGKITAREVLANWNYYLFFVFNHDFAKAYFGCEKK